MRSVIFAAGVAIAAVLVGLLLTTRLQAQKHKPQIQAEQTPTEMAPPTQEDTTAGGIPNRMITREELAAHDGSRFPELPLWLSLGGIVFDVTEGGTEFYGCAHPY